MVIQITGFTSGYYEEEESRPIIKRALDLEINFFDTANVYSLGHSEEILGKVLKDYANRDEIILATKVHQKMFDGPNGQGLSRKAIMSQINDNVFRLGKKITNYESKINNCEMRRLSK
ncbi:MULTISPECIES: aldo/keto reductase [unclassified Clostridioides]|uniref:aldo/keto reductase n=1 Tax=unclassified Clostridioides TaxID=2635829 RepID=UPI001D12BDA6